LFDEHILHFEMHEECGERFLIHEGMITRSPSKKALDIIKKPSRD
jgi:hypothetical protein